jgi:hypothetical protein
MKLSVRDARKLIRDTFEKSFNKEQFIYFINNLLKDSYEPKPYLQTGERLPDAYAAYIKKLERIGTYEDETGLIIDILLVELKKDHSVEFARHTQRNFIRRYLSGSSGGGLKDAALIAFYSECSEDWRFSLIKMQYSLERKKDDLTPAKRFSFLVGANEKSHTAQKQLTELLTMDCVPGLEAIESAFSIETVTLEFFEKYKELFICVSEFFEKQISKNSNLKNELTTKGIDHISFAKKLLGQIVFLYFLQKKGWLGVDKNGKWGDGDKKFLMTLLERAITEHKNFYSDYLQFLFYEALAEERRESSEPSYYKRLNCKIPFLNGGLFEADYDWRNIEVKIPNSFFFNEKMTDEGDIGDGILNVFDRYNFTVKEDEPLDKEVAVDPEMLGKVFENLLEVKDRKSKGAFYTPREIVHYMCEESLINYLNTSINHQPIVYQHIGMDQTDMFGNAIKNGQLPIEIEHNTDERVSRNDLELFIREGISGIEHDEAKEAGKLTSEKHALPISIRNNAQELDHALCNIRVCDPAIGSGAFPVGIMNEIVKAREILTTYLPINVQKARTPYELKRHCIQECIYGVDIEHSAVDIAKLRLWLSLVVDENDLSQVKPLPNLDYKIVEGNSLIGYPYQPQGLSAIEKLKTIFFELTDHKEKEEYRNRINSAIQDLLRNTKKSLGVAVNFDFRIHFSEVFHEKNGFDIVIGNPPYVLLQADNKDKDVIKYFKNAYKVASYKVDLYHLFLERGISLLRINGTISYINPSTFLSNNYTESLRKYILRETEVNKIINIDEDVFEASVNTCILLLTRNNSEFKKISFAFGNIINGYFQLSNIITQNQNDFSTENSLLIPVSNSNISNLLKKIEQNNGKVNIFFNVNFGMQLRDRKVHTQDVLVNPEISKLTKFHKKCFTGKDINKFSVQYNERYCYFNRTAQRGGCWDEKLHFIKNKVLIRQIGNTPIAGIDSLGYPVLNSAFMVTPKRSDVSMKIFLGIINSKFISFFWNFKFADKRKTFPKIKGTYIELLPYPNTFSSLGGTLIIKLIDELIELKSSKTDFNTDKLEKKIDIIVYHLYNLTYEEANIIDSELTSEEFQKYQS